MAASPYPPKMSLDSLEGALSLFLSEVLSAIAGSEAIPQAMANARNFVFMFFSFFFFGKGMGG